MRDRYAGERGRRDRRADARHDLERYSGGSQGKTFFTAPSEHERIPALQSHDFPAVPRSTNHQPVNELLADLRTTGALADEYALRRRRELEDGSVDQRVVEDEICVSEARDGLA